MFLLGFRRKMTALALCKSIESAIQWFHIHHRITFATIQNPAVYLSGARVSIFSTLVPRLNVQLHILSLIPDNFQGVAKNDSDGLPKPSRVNIVTKENL